MYSLFGRVCELVLSPSVVALCDALVSPQVLDGLHVGALEGGDRLEVNRPDQVGLLLRGGKEGG